MLYIEPLVERAEQLGKTSYELIKLKAIYTVSKVVSGFISKALFIFTLIMSTVILTVGIALWLGDILGKSYYGFFCVAGFYGIIGFVLYFFLLHKIKKTISNSIVLQILN